MCGWPLLLLWGLLPGAAAGGSGRALPHQTVLDSQGKYWLSWGPRGGRLAFRLEVRTAGYVGFGFSPTGAMAAADIVVGGVAQGRPYLQVSASAPGARPGPARPRAGACAGAPGAAGVLCGGGWKPSSPPPRGPDPARSPGRSPAPLEPKAPRSSAGPGGCSGKPSPGDVGQLSVCPQRPTSQVPHIHIAWGDVAHPHSSLMGKEDDPSGT